MYIKITNGQATYPYSIQQLKAENPQVSFPTEPSAESLAEFDVYEVVASEMPSITYSQKIVENTPVSIDGKWVQQWSVVDMVGDELLARVRDLRASEYPPMSDYLDGIVKGDQAQIQAYIDACLAVKAKYPKP